MACRPHVFLATVAALSAISYTRQGPVRETKNGKIRGLVRDSGIGGDIEVYLGVPFAKPPIGDLRFEMPEPVEPWADVREAVDLPPMCIQSTVPPYYVNQHRPDFKVASEDCLYLNVFVPHAVQTPGNKYAVLVYIHGGSNVDGYSLMFDGDILAIYGDIIVVTIAYRLGVLGFLGSVGTVMAGNYAMHDLILGLQWVHDNIEIFNGDPSMVTVMGHSAGGWDVGALVVAPLAKGLFSAAILQSGPPLSMTASSSGYRLDEVRRIAADYDCNYNTYDAILSCLKSKDYQTILLPYNETKVTYHALYPSPLLPDDPQKLYRYGDINVQHLMTGVTASESDEWVYSAVEHFVRLQKKTTKSFDWDWIWQTLVYLEIFAAPPNKLLAESIIHEYTNWNDPDDSYELQRSFSKAMGEAWMDIPTVTMADILSQRGRTVFLYQFAHRSLTDRPVTPWMDVPHGTDVFYVFGVPLKDHVVRQYDEIDKEMSKLVMEHWSNFVKYRNPAPNKTMQENFVYNLKNQTYFRLTSEGGKPEITLDRHFKTRSKHFWNVLVPHLNGASETIQMCHILHLIVTGLHYCLF